MFEGGRDLSPQRLSELPEGVQLVDVREPWEHALAHLPGAILIPLGQLEVRLGELDPRRPVVAYCHHGVRSLHALRLLAAHGFEDLAHLAGGIDAYSRHDPSVPRY